MTTREQVVTLHSEGLRVLDIAHRMGMSLNAVYYHLRQHQMGKAQHGRNRRTERKTMYGPKKCRCGVVIAPESEHCVPCSAKERSRDKDELVQRLIAHAEATGFVPTASEAVPLTGMSRTITAEIIRRTFGPHPGPTNRRRRYNQASVAA